MELDSPFGFDFTDLDDMAGKTQSKSDLNGPALANAFALANILGYPNSAASLESFPHFQAGVTFGAGCTNMEYFDDSSGAKDRGSLPMIIPNPVFHFGIGIIGGLDFIGKIFILDSSMISASIENDLATPEDYSLYSIGGRVRYNLVPRFTIVPALFSFGGITVAFGADAMLGRARIHGEYQAYFEDIDIDDGGPVINIDRVDFDGDYDAEITWKVLSATTTANVYFELFSIFTVYTGFGLTLGVGRFSSEFIGVGDFTTEDPDYLLVEGSGDIGTLTFTSKNKYRADPFIPAYILGAEVSLFFFKLHVETMVNLNNGKDVTALIGARIQF